MLTHLWIFLCSSILKNLFICLCVSQNSGLMIYCTGVRSYQDGGSKFINYSIRWNLDHRETFFGRGHPNNPGPPVLYLACTFFLAYLLLGPGVSI